MMPNLVESGMYAFSLIAYSTVAATIPTILTSPAPRATDPHIELTSDASSYDANCTGCHASTHSGTDPGAPQKPTSTHLLSKPAAVPSEGKPCPVAGSLRCCHMPKVELPGRTLQVHRPPASALSARRPLSFLSSDDINAGPCLAARSRHKPSHSARVALGGN